MDLLDLVGKTFMMPAFKPEEGGFVLVEKTVKSWCDGSDFASDIFTIEEEGVEKEVSAFGFVENLINALRNMEKM